jgi:nucleoid-associated protein YgaU
MPILLLLLGVATFAVVAANANYKKPPPQTFTLDNNMPPDLRNQVLAALVSENDPAKLEAFAGALASIYPLSSSQLHAKAASLGGRGVAFPPVPLPAAQPVPSGSSILEIGQLPEPTRSQVLQQIATGNDPAALEAFASQLAAISPAAASALRLRASLLRSVPTMPVPAAPSPVPQAADVAPPQAFPTSPAPTSPATPAAIPPGLGLDPGMPPEVAQAVMNALTRETDPTKLRGFAASLAPQFPIAAALLTAKANTLAVLVPPPPAPAPMPAPMPSGVPAFVPPTSGTYVVQAGDFPIKIARKLVHDEARWPELVAANPTKKRAPDGNFATLLPGEVLQLPASWGVPPTFEAVSLPRIATPMLASGHIYVVQPGDFPIKIAQKLIHDGHRWHELIAANPAKKRASDGNFASLQPGERLQLPASWTAAQTPFLLNPGGSHDAASA